MHHTPRTRPVLILCTALLLLVVYGYGTNLTTRAQEVRGAEPLLTLTIPPTSTPTATPTPPWTCGGRSMLCTPTPTLTPTFTPTSVREFPCPLHAAATRCTPTPLDPALCVIHIDGGAEATNQKQVEIFIDVPYVHSVWLFNGNQHHEGGWQPYLLRMPWTLDVGHRRVATATVRARLLGGNGLEMCGSLSDTILYDSLPPAVTIDSFTWHSTGSASAVDSTISGVLTLDAVDQEEGSGVAAMQVSKRVDFADVAWQPYAPEVNVTINPGDHLHVRVRDGAGNVSAAASLAFALPPPDSSTFLPLITSP